MIILYPLLSYYLPGPSSIDSCFTGSDCTGATVPLTSTRLVAQIRECCLSDNGRSYNVLGQCANCVGKCCSLSVCYINGMVSSTGMVSFRNYSRGGEGLIQEMLRG